MVLVVTEFVSSNYFSMKVCSITNVSDDDCLFSIEVVGSLRVLCIPQLIKKWTPLKSTIVLKIELQINQQINQTINHLILIMLYKLYLEFENSDRLSTRMASETILILTLSISPNLSHVSIKIQTSSSYGYTFHNSLGIQELEAAT